MSRRTEAAKKSGWAVWITGLPGSGKSTLADGVLKALRQRGLNAEILRMDEQRKKYIPRPQYTEEEREIAYRMFAEEAAAIAASGQGVIMDGTAHRLAWRSRARALIPKFAEIHLQVPLETAMHREAGRPQGLVMADLYAKALERRRSGDCPKGLGQVVGVDIPFEEDPDAECVVENNGLDPESAVRQVMEFLLFWLDVPAAD
jgi:adenylylsulfate kinase